MSSTKSLLVELLVEELPPKALKRLGDAFAQLLADGLKAQGLTTDHSALTSFATPRRLAAHVSAVLPAGPDQEVVTRLMPSAVALDKQGRPTDALRKRLAKHGLERLAELWPEASEGLGGIYAQSDGKVDAVFLRQFVHGATLRDGLQNALEHAIEKLPIDKVMTYQLADGWSNVQFVRPVHALVALHGPDVVPVSAFGLHAGRETRGHRFEAPIEEILLQHADQYAQQLFDQGAVIASFSKRHGEIARQLHHVATQQGLTPIEDAALLDEVTALVERPNVLLGRFDESFLALPQECLILTMKANQKYFPLLDARGRLTNRFLIVSNIQPNNPTAVIRGNERVMRPRLADAKFFFDQDRRKTLESRLAGLDQVVYHGKLGSLGARVDRVRAIATEIGLRLGGAALAAKADQAARLAKADLLTDMVGEFPELQGTMGRYYAQHDGFAEDVAWAIADHYRPRFAGDELPRNEVGVVLALADKLEILVGLFGIDQGPTGDKDPFALRRHALGVLRMLMELELAIDLRELVDIASEACVAALGKESKWPLLADKRNADSVPDLIYEACGPFLLDRLSGNLREQGFSAAEVEAVLALQPARLATVPRMLRAVREFQSLPEAAALAAANKRIVNILKKAADDVAPHFDPALLREPAELALAQALAAVKPEADAAFSRADYAASLKSLARLKLPVDAFFDTVMVNVEDAALRANRLGLLATLRAVMNRVADLSKLAVQA